MSIIPNEKNIRLIFGLKLKELRKNKGLSFAKLAKVSGLSISYLNEIEKGKKYPKTDKIVALSRSLGVAYDHLVSLKLGKKLAPIADLLNSNILQDLHLDVFGLDSGKLVDMIGKAPLKVSAFISTLIKIARNYDMDKEQFYLAALRSYQELHDNYFEDLEQKVEKFVRKYDIDTEPPIDVIQLSRILEEKYDYTIDNQTLVQDEKLKEFRSVYAPDKKTLYIHNNLTPTQKSFLLGKEIAFNYLNLKERPYTTKLFRVNTFEEALNNFKASYFSVALLMNRATFIEDLQGFFEQTEWNSEAFIALMQKYQATSEMFLHRLTNLLPRQFGINNIFFLRFNSEIGSDDFAVTKELHMNRLHIPHESSVEHYCRRWNAIRALKNLENLQQNESVTKPIVQIQRSRFIGTETEYLSITIARAMSPTPNTNVSVTIGLGIDEHLKKKVRFWNDPNIPTEEVNKTCERCPIKDCQERVSEPTIFQENENRKEVEKALANLSGDVVEGFSLN